MKTIIKFIAGVSAVLFGLWGLDSISDTLFVPYTSGSNLTLVTGGSGGFGPFIVISAGLKCVISSTTLLTGIVGLGYLLGTLLAGSDPARQVRIGVNLGQHRARAGNRSRLRSERVPARRDMPGL